MLYFAGMTVLPPFICFSPARVTDDERKQQLELYKTYLSATSNTTPIYKAL